MNREPAVEILPDRVVKTNRPSLLAVEAEKTRRAHELGRATGLFRVPKVLSFDPAAGRLELERLPALTSLRHVLLRSRDWRAPLVKLGHGLAVIHDQLELPASLAHPLPDRWQLDGMDNVTVHGDLNMENVQVDQTDGALVILDWSVTPMLQCAGTCGPAAFDLAWLARALFLIRRPSGFFSRRVHAELDVVLTSYLEHTSKPQSVDRILGYLQRIAAPLRDLMLQFYGTWWLRRIDCSLHMQRYDRWARSDALRRTCEAAARRASSQKRPVANE